ncbi:MAG: cell division protein FtsZ [Candidatus Babeliaceae bacterium]
MIDFDVEKNKELGTRIKVIGVGGAGGNAVNSMLAFPYEHVEFIVANTDAQALNISPTPLKLQLGIKLTKGLGTGANPDLGKRAAEEDREKIIEYVQNADIVFLVAGLGGGTGSGALPVIAHILKEKNILSIAVVTKPFDFEGKRRMQVAHQALEELKKQVDSLIVIPNQKLLENSDQQVTMLDGFASINQVINQFVKSIVDIMNKSGYINVDFADLRAIMKDTGLAVMGTGCASGTDRAEQATLQAINSPLLENINIQGAHGVLLNITGNASLGLHEVSVAASLIYEKAHENANIILGAVIDENADEQVHVTLIATGFAAPSLQQMHPAPALHPAASERNNVAPEYNNQMARTFTPQTLASPALDMQDIEVPTALRRLVLEKKAQLKS